MHPGGLAAANLADGPGAREEIEARAGRDSIASGRVISVWLECSGDLLDLHLVDILGIHEPTPGIELIEFTCPHCGRAHLSLRFA